MKKYDHKKIESKWQKIWEKSGIYKTKDTGFFSRIFKKKLYVLDMFPYPSGEGLHVGHPRGYIATDIYSRYKTMSGYNILHPMGFDSFGLPAEQFAIKHKIRPSVAVKKNIKRYKEQLSILGFNYDWDREVHTSDPEYYKWTQWIFLKLFEKGLAYQSYEPINWCPTCQTGLALEDLEDGECERCGTIVEKKPMRQWVLKITDYADRMLEDLGELNWPESIKELQRNWIGRSEGALIKFPISPASPLRRGEAGNFKFPGKVVLMHGKNVDPTQKWYPWLAKEVKKKDVEFIAPYLPEADDPEVNAWMKELDKTNPDENTILIGHSRGGVAILRWLEKIEKGKRVKKVILLGTNSGRSPKPSRGFFTKEGYNFEKIKLHCDNFVVLHSKDDHIVPFEAGEENAKGLNAKFLIFENKGHFGKSTSPTIPELISELFSKNEIEVFTTRPDTLFGATYMVLSPEHPLLSGLKGQITNWKEAEKYIEEAKKKTEIERTAEGKEKSGVELKGIKAINPTNNEEIPVWVADYVLAHYGTGAIMAVPAHDQRDHDFAKKHNLPIKIVIEPVTGEKRENEEFRRSIVALVWDPKSKKILSINWGNHGGNLLIGGGLRDKEDPIECAVREIREETGYKNVRFIEQSEKIHHHYFASSKNVNREIEAIGLYFELLNEEKVDQNLEDDENGKFSVEWINSKQAEMAITDPLHKYIFEKFILGKTYTGDGIMTHSGKFDGMESGEAKKAITKLVNGKEKVNYKLRDWVFSRQRYWGEPIPIIHCEKCGVVPVPEKDLPVELPEVEHYEPTGTGESPLANITEWVNTTCPKCGGSAKRETNTMPQWAGSSWYYLRYIDPYNKKVLVDKKKEKYWSPIDLYVGGTEHATRHLIYARFWHKFLYDIGVVNYKEPFTQLKNQGMILGDDGRKMSKRWGNVVNPDDVVETYGADTLRIYEMFMGPFDQLVNWSTESIIGPRRFLEKIWRIGGKITNNKSQIPNKSQIQNSNDQNKKLESLLHKTIKKVTEDIENFHFNTAISQMMIFVNEAEKEPEIPRGYFEVFLQLLAPLAPHIAEELWHELGNEKSIHVSEWPQYDESKIVEEMITLVVQVNGKVRTNIEIEAGLSEDKVKEIALANETVKKWISEKEIMKIIYVENKLINIVV